MSTVGFIGCGNMGGALCNAISKAIGGKNIYISDNNKEKVMAVSKETGCNISDNLTIAKECTYIFLAVKPQVLKSVLSSIKDVLKSRTDRFIIVTMAAGTKSEKVLNMCDGTYPIIRIMPNTPCQIGKGMILYSPSDDITQKEVDEFSSFFSEGGICDLIDEKLIDAASAISGCGPAFVYLFIEALSDGGVLCGLPRDKALLYASQTLIGASEMVLKSGKHPGELKDAVCSPGGTTIEGVKALEDSKFRSACINAVQKAYEKNFKL